MYQVSVEQHFDAAHYLRDYQGKCENLHGHRFKIVITVEARKLDKIGLAYDFVELKKLLGNVIDRFDHVCLNDISPFDTINPSSENIAAIIHERLKPQLPEQISLSTVAVWESPQSCVTYSS